MRGLVISPCLPYNLLFIHWPAIISTSALLKKKKKWQCYFRMVIIEVSLENYAIPLAKHIHTYFMCVNVCCHVWLFATPWTVPARLLCPRDFSGKNTGVGCHFLVKGIFPTQESNTSSASPSFAGRFFTTEPPGKFYICICIYILHT